MLLLKRAATALVLAGIIGGIFFQVAFSGLAGSQAALAQIQKHPIGTRPPEFQRDFTENYRLGLEVRHRVWVEHGVALLRYSFLAGLIIALPLSFTNIFPWCRRGLRPPPLPTGGPPHARS